MSLTFSQLEILEFLTERMKTGHGEVVKLGKISVQQMLKASYSCHVVLKKKTCKIFRVNSFRL